MAKMFIGGESVDSVTKNTTRCVIPPPAPRSIPCRKATTRTCNRRFKRQRMLSKFGPTFRPRIAAMP